MPKIIKKNRYNEAQTNHINGSFSSTLCTRKKLGIDFGFIVWYSILFCLSDAPSYNVVNPVVGVIQSAAHNLAYLWDRRSIVISSNTLARPINNCWTHPNDRRAVIQPRPRPRDHALEKAVGHHRWPLVIPKPKSEEHAGKVDHSGYSGDANCRAERFARRFVSPSISSNTFQERMGVAWA